PVCVRSARVLATGVGSPRGGTRLSGFGGGKSARELATEDGGCRLFRHDDAAANCPSVPNPRVWDTGTVGTIASASSDTHPAGVCCLTDGDRWGMMAAMRQASCIGVCP